MSRNGVTGWMRTDFDFGSPCKVFFVEIFQDASFDLRDALAATQNDLDEMAKRIGEVVRFYRPELEGGTVLRVEMNDRDRIWRIWYTHPSLPRHREWGSRYPEERLQKCVGCSNGLPVDGVFHKAVTENGMNRFMSYCSKECCDKSESQTALRVDEATGADESQVIGWKKWL